MPTGKPKFYWDAAPLIAWITNEVSIPLVTGLHADDLYGDGALTASEYFLLNLDITARLLSSNLAGNRVRAPSPT